MRRAIPEQLTSNKNIIWCVWVCSQKAIGCKSS